MNKDLIKKVNDLYTWRRQQIVDLWQEVAFRQGEAKLSLGARQLDEVDIMFQGYISKHAKLLDRLNNLDNEYVSIFKVLNNINIWFKLFSWIPYLKVNQEMQNQLNAFIARWEEYEPGW